MEVRDFAIAANTTGNHDQKKSSSPSQQEIATPQVVEGEGEKHFTNRGHVHGRHRRPSSPESSCFLYTPDEERRVVKKLDWKLVLFLAFLYMLSFLDRSSMY